MLPSRKILMGITGAALVALGVICVTKPIATLVSLAWIIGIVTLVSGISTLVNWANMRKYVTQSGSIFLSAILQILIGIIFLRHDLILAVILPFMFAFYLIFEGINLSVRSFDYKKVGFKAWWLNLALGLASAVLGFISLSTPAVAGASLSAFVGVGFITVGVVYFVALFAVNRFEKKLSKNPWVDEQ